MYSTVDVCVFSVLDVSWYAGQAALVYWCANTRSGNVRLFSPSGKEAVEEVREIMCFSCEDQKHTCWYIERLLVHNITCGYDMNFEDSEEN